MTSENVEHAGEPRGSARGVLVAVAIALVPLAILARHLNLVFDDAYISFRYGRHLAEGHGLVFNLGESPPVEGYSNLLWVLWCAVAEALGVDVTVWARASLFACAAALLALVTRTAARRVDLGTPGLIAVALFLGASPTIALYATGGLETLPFVLAVFVAWERLFGEPADDERADGAPPTNARGVQAGLAGLAACLLRPDAPVWIGAILALALLSAFAGKRRDLRGAARIACAVVAAGVLAHVGWRLWYHGDWIPNTARVKGNLSAQTLERGARYALSYVLTLPAVALVIVLGAARGLVRRDGLALHALALVVITFAYAIVVGGDFLPFGRFLAPALPFAALLLATLLPRRGSDAQPVALALVAVACLVTALPAYGRHPVPHGLRAHGHYCWNFPDYVPEIELVDGERRRARIWAELGRALAYALPPTDTLVQDSVGAVGYHCDLVLYDQYGLTDRELAREPPTDERVSAGHEKYVRPSWFEKREPRWMHATVIDVDADGEPLRRIGNAGRYASDVVPLPTDAGFRPGRALWLQRLRSAPSYFAGR